MFKKLSLSALLMSTLPLFGVIDTNQYLSKESLPKAPQSLILPVPDELFNEKWQFAFADSSEDGAYVLEFTPKNESIENWNELIQIQYFPLTKEMKGKITAEIFADHFLKALKSHFPDATTQIIKKEPFSVLLEWKLPKKVENESQQDEIALIIVNSSGLFRAAYTKKVADLTQKEREMWTDIISRALISDAQPAS
jgi:hypothetical protein